MIAKINNLINRIAPEYISISDTSNLFKKYEEAISVIMQTDKTAELYQNFNENFSLFLSKLPNGIVKNSVSEAFNKDIIYIGLSSIHNPGIFVRVGVEGSKLRVLMLDARLLNIDIKTGETPNIDDCIYAAYFGVVRGCLLAHKDNVKKDLDLHKLMTTYLYLLVRKTLGKHILLNDKQQSMLMFICQFIYLRHFLGDSDSAALYKIKKSFLQSVPDGDKYFEEFKNLSTILKNFRNIKDIFKVCSSTNILVGINHNKLLLDLISLIGQAAFYSLISSLDTFCAFVCTSLYPFSFYKQGAFLNDKLQHSIESLIYDKYIKHTEFSPLTKKR